MTALVATLASAAPDRSEQVWDSGRREAGWAQSVVTADAGLGRCTDNLSPCRAIQYTAGRGVGAGEASLTVTKHAHPNPVQAGARLTYVIQVSNTCDVGLQATITDVLPSSVVPVSGTVWLPGGRVGITWTSFISPFGVWSRQFFVTVPRDFVGTLTNVVRVATEQGATGVYTTTTPVLHWLYLPLVIRASAPQPYTCPTTSGNVYSAGIAKQYDQDDPVRPAYNHADKNLSLRGYGPNPGTDFRRELVDYGSDDPTMPPQFAALFEPHRVPNLLGFYRVNNWHWAPSPEPGSRGDPITTWPVTALGLETTPGETLFVPQSGYEIGGGMEVIVLFADQDTVALKYAREDSAGSPGYTVHIDQICTDPNLLSLYDALDDASGPRYRFPNAAYDLPNLSAGASLGTARGEEVVVAIVDTGGFMDPRSCNEWWQIRPGYAGSCPPHE